MATTEAAAETEPVGDFRPYRMTIERYEKLASSGVYPKNAPIFLWGGRLVEKIREGFGPTPEGNFPDHRMTIDRFLRLIEAGVFGEDDNIFLWGGRLVEKMTKGRHHSFAALKLDRLLDRILPGEFHSEIEQPMILGDDSLPEPDVMVLRGPLDDYRDRMPATRDVALLIEVADSSVGPNSVAKLKRYATEGIPIYWIVNIPKGRIEVYSRPTGPDEKPSYLEHREYGPDDEVPVVLDGHEVGRIPAREVLP